MIRKDGTHQIWTGPVNDRGKPVLRGKYHLNRVAWPNYWQVPPHQLQGRRLQRICKPMTCLQPTHYVLANPESAYKALGWARGQRRLAREVFATEGQRGGLRGCWWDASRIEEEPACFGPPLMVVKALAGRMGWPHLGVLAVWSDLVRRNLRESR